MKKSRLLPKILFGQNTVKLRSLFNRWLSSMLYLMEMSIHSKVLKLINTKDKHGCKTFADPYVHDILNESMTGFNVFELLIIKRGS